MNKTQQLSNIVLLEFLKKFSGDIYIIALPAIAASLNTDRQHVQIMISFFLVGVALSQLFTGSLSDHIGRRPVLLNCLIIFSLGCFVCVFGAAIWILLLGVFIMGLGIGSAPSIGKAIIHDLYKKSGKTALFLVITSAFVVWAPAISMAVGGNFAHYFGWQSIFLLSGILGVISFIITFFMLAETKERHHHSKGVKTLVIGYYHALSHAGFCLSLLGLALIASGVFVFYSAGIFVLHHSLSIPLNIVGYLIFTLAFGNFSGKFFGGFLSTRLRPITSLLLTSSIAVICAAVMLLFALLHETNVYVIILPMVGYMFSLGSTMPVARTHLMNLLHEHTGAASGLTGIIIALSASLMTFVTSHFHIQSIIPVAGILTAITVLAWCLFLLGYWLFKHEH